MSAHRLLLGHCSELFAQLPDHSVHAVCTDPPYGLVEFSPAEVAKLREGKGGIWRLPPDWDGCKRRPLPRFSVLTLEQKQAIEDFFYGWAVALKPKLRPGAHVLVAGNPTLQMYVQNALVRAGLESRATLLRVYHGFRGGDRPKNAETEFPGVCVTPRGNYEPWMLFRNPIAEKTVAQNLRRWGTGGLRMLAGGKPLPDVIPSFKTPVREREIADHPSLKPQHLLRIFVRALLPLGKGTVLDPFAGSGSTLAAAIALDPVSIESVGMEVDPQYHALAKSSILRLAGLYPGMDGSVLEAGEVNGAAEEFEDQLQLLESPGKYRVR
jgi:site-specific DNA-methyltransferase (adenine-specific)